MLTRWIRKIWMQLLIAFDPNYTREGFERTGKSFSLPSGIAECEPSLKRKYTICNLFVNQGHSIVTIARVLDVSPGKVVGTLIEEGILKERRRAAGRKASQERRQRHVRTNLPLQRIDAAGNGSANPDPARQLVSPTEAAPQEDLNQQGPKNSTSMNAEELSKPANSLRSITLARRAASTRG